MSSGSLYNKSPAFFRLKKNSMYLRAFTPGFPDHNGLLHAWQRWLIDADGHLGTHAIEAATPVVQHVHLTVIPLCK